MQASANSKNKIKFEFQEVISSSDIFVRAETRVRPVRSLAASTL